MTTTEQVLDLFLNRGHEGAMNQVMNECFKTC